MAEMKNNPTVKTISKEMIKPSLPTPSHLRNYQISSIDQLADLSYIRILFFYGPPFAGKAAISGETADVIQVLKSSLSETLTHYYPLAGKFVAEQGLVDCDDSGAEFISAVIVDGEENAFSDVIKNPNIDFLEKLLNKEDNMKSDDVLLSVQVTRFHGGAITVGVCLSHKISDASALFSFMKCWSAAAHNESTCSTELTALGPILDASKLWPYIPSLTRPSVSFKTGGTIITKKFFFSASSLRKLKAELDVGLVGIIPTRVTSLMALLWHVVMNSSPASSSIPVKHMITIPTNIRKVMSPPLPENAFGNISKITGVVKCTDGVTPLPGTETEQWNEVRELLRLIKKSIEKVDDEYARKKGMHVPEEFSFGRGMKMDLLATTSWCGFAFYDIDFGLCRPIWMTTLMRPISHLVFLLQGPDGGMDVLASLNEETMEKFEKNPTLLSFCDNYVTFG